ncbi:MAG: chitobiase/beta-hexosaminidase C-terminal domain-containing protein [Bacteroidales bacterium]|nr:chitobiase/beta-hexosaminidase C-terminal domain-containing protein [Bacteroidales bacterium]
MKKNIFYTLAAVVTFLTFSCSKDTEVQTPDKPVPVDPIVPTEKSVVLSGAVDATKVSSDNNGAYKWQASDIITILTDNGNNREFTAEEAGISTDFSGHIPDADELEGGFALYPASENHSISGTTITFNMPNELAWGADASYMPMYAPITIVEQKPSASFKAVGGALKLILYNIPSGAAYLAFTAASVNIAGDFSLDTTAETPVISGGESKEIDINFSDNYSANKVFYIPLPPVTLTGGFTISIFDDEANELFSVTSTKGITIGRNKLVIAPALNCSPAPDDATLTNADLVSAAWSSGSYTTSSITNASGTWNFNAAYAGNYGKSGNYYMQLRNNSTVSYLQLPDFSNDISSIILHGVCNALETQYAGSIYFRENADNDEEPIATAPTASSAQQDLTMTIPAGYSTGYIMVSGACKIAAFTVKFRGEAYTAPSITANDNALTIGVGQSSASTTISLANAIDGLGISAIVSGEDAENFTAAIDGTTLTVTAEAANTTAADKVATVTLKASGASSKAISVTQASCLVPNPTDLTAIAGDAEVDVTWTGDAHATSYVAYLHTAATATPATGDTNITSSISNSGSNYSIADYSSVVNDQTYYLYIKVNGVASGYVAPTDFAVVSFTPAQAKGTAENPYLASEAYDIVSAYASGEGPTGTIYVKGYVSSASNPSSNSQTYFISDDGSTTEKKFEVYKGKGISGADIDDANKVSVGDWVVVSGTAINYSGTTPEFSAGSTIYTHNPKLAAPEFTPAAGTYYSAQSVAISATNSATIYYTTDGTDPDENSDEYEEPIAVSADMTIKAIAVKADFVTSAVASATYDIEAPIQLGNPSVTCSAHGEDYLTFAWETVTNGTDGTTEYAVSLDGGSNWEAAQTARTYTWSSLSSNTSYTIKVKALGTNNGQYLESLTPGSCTQSTDAPSAGWKETALSSIGPGDVFVIVGNDSYGINNTPGNSSPSAVSVTVSGSKLTGTIPNTVKWNLAVVTGGYTFYPNGDDTNWLGSNTTSSSGNNTSIRVGTQSRKVWELDGSNHLLTNDTYTDRYLAVYNGTDWRGYVGSGTSETTFKFYKYTDNTPRTISVTTPTNGTVTTDPAGTTTAGTSVTITATPADGYVVRNVSVLDGSSAAVSVTTVDATHYRFSMPSSDATVTVTFGRQNTVSLAYGTDPAHGSISISPASPVFEGETVTVTSNPDSGYMLNALTYNDGSSHDILSAKSFTMPGTAVTVTATFVAVPTISVTNPITNVSATAGTYTINNAYTLLNGATSANVTVSEPDNTVVTAVSKGASDGSISITVSGNTGSARNGSFKIKYGDEAYRTITVSQVSGSSTPDVGTVLFAETFGSSAVSPFSSYTGTGSSSYNSASTLTYTCKSTNTKIMNDTQGNCGPANLLVGGKNGGDGEWAKISGIKTYGATQVTVTWASNNTVVKVSIEESSSAAVTSANSASNSGTFTLSGEEETITLVMTAGSKNNGRVDTIQITVAD